MRGAVGYFSVWIIPALGFWAMGRGPFAFFILLSVIFILHPILDATITQWDTQKKLQLGNLSQQSPHWVFQIPLHSAFPLQMILLLYAFYAGTHSLSTAILSGIICGVSGGIMGMCAAHELIHRKSKSEKVLGKALLHVLHYPHFHVEHFWHHLKLASPEDVSSATRNESLYAFLIRSTWSGWMISWKWKPKKMAVSAMIQIALILTVYFIAGSLAVLLWFVQGVVTVLLLKWIDYLEHYGLERETVKGQLEKVNTFHSWDSTRVFTNWYLYNLGFHSQHHQTPSVPYAELPRKKTEWNEHPYGYSTMMLIALFPPLWRNTLHPILDQSASAKSLRVEA
jgi:alkane 1-monooxygenase